jgi:uncharacterized membrane protein YcaP (DUF421 family)
MHQLFDVNWSELFVPQTSLLELFIRGSLTYILLFIFLRFLRRQLGAIGITDVLVIVLVADAAQNGMSGDYKSITEGVFLVVTIAAWDFVLDYLGHKSQTIQRLLRPKELLLVENGQPQRRNMQKEMITMEELMSQLREQGIEDLKEVKKAYLEGDGKISVISEDKEQKTQNQDDRENVMH